MDGAAPTKFLFDPAEVTARLAELPHLRDAIGDRAREHERSRAFSNGRKSERELYRVLSNFQYPHLDRLLRCLDSCLGHGFIQPTIMRTRARKDFAGALAELHAAEHFLLRNFAVEGFETNKGDQPVPDMRLRKEGVDIAVEVYCPRQWEGLADLIEDLKDAVKNLDVPLDYRFELSVNQLERFGATGGLIYLHPGELACALDAKTRKAILRALVDSAEARLAGGGAKDVRVEHDERQLNIKTTVKLDGIEPSHGPLPARDGSISGPSLGGYAPEGMFERILKRVLAKAGKGQAVGYASLSLLLVDLSRSELTRDLLHYRDEFEVQVQQRLGGGLCGYDMIAFCESRGWQGELPLHYLAYEHTVPVEVRQLLFGDQLV